MKRLFGRNKQANTKSYDPEVMIPAIRCSICTGEEVAGFVDKAGGHFTDVMLIRTPEDLAAFKKTFGLTGDIPKIY